jgi:tRNA-dihydrouridine synthase
LDGWFVDPLSTSSRQDNGSTAVVVGTNAQYDAAMYRGWPPRSSTRQSSFGTHCTLFDQTGESNAAIRESKYDALMGASRLSLAPMMEYTDRHFRHLVRLISKRTLLYTEMVTVNAISHERRAVVDEFRQSNPHATESQVRQGYDDVYLRRYLSQGFIEPLEGPSVLQVGGSDPQQMHDASQTVMDMAKRGICDYTAIDSNCGCPSPKVAGKGCFGAALMEDGNLVAEFTRALHDGCDGALPITVKCRIGTDINSPFTKMGYQAIDRRGIFEVMSIR